MITKFKYEWRYLIIIGVYILEEVKKVEMTCFCQELQQILDTYNKQYSVVLVGHLNAQVGNAPIQILLGSYRKSTVNSNSEIFKN